MTDMTGSEQRDEALSLVGALSAALRGMGVEANLALLECEAAGGGAGLYGVNDAVLSTDETIYAVGDLMPLPELVPALGFALDLVHYVQSKTEEGAS